VLTNLSTLENQSAYYTLSWTGNCICIKVHHTVAMHFETTLKFFLRQVGALQEELDLPLFYSPLNRRWGFGQVLELYGESDDEWVSWRCSLPRRSVGEDICWEDITAISASLSILFRVLLTLSVQERAVTERPQLFLIPRMPIGKDMRSHGFSVELSPAFHEWFAKSDIKPFQKVSDAMKQAYACMLGHREGATFKIEIKPPSMLVMQIPGNAASLYLEKEDDELQPTNVDSVLQQLTLLAGVAALWDIIEKANKVSTQ
jgi:hypothetical protein